MADCSPKYPRPDFMRTNLNWQSLNGLWFFIFDDDDVGVINSWPEQGLPIEDMVTGSLEDVTTSWRTTTITQRIAAGTQELIENNAHAQSSNTICRRCLINVPFVFQCPASGIGDRSRHSRFWYERQFSDIRTHEGKMKGQRLLLRFGAVDYVTEVWVNGMFLGRHVGGHVPFDMDMTQILSELPFSSYYRLIVRVVDSYSLDQPRGKQYWFAQPESIFYTPSSGIWQDVWIEVVSRKWIADSSHGTVLRSDNIETGQLSCHLSLSGRHSFRPCHVEAAAVIGGVFVAKSQPTLALPDPVDPSEHIADLTLNMRLSEQMRSRLPYSILDMAPLDDAQCWRDGLALWSPEHPLLYDVCFTLIDYGTGEVLDEINTQVGMRSIDWSASDGLWRLNNRPYFQALCLDQGYWPESFITPPNGNAAKVDIELAKRMGFNGCRKHQKVEDPMFNYWADKLGYLVWAECPNAYEFTPDYVTHMNDEWAKAVKLAINHACVVTWTPVNESWGYTSLKDSEEQQSHIRSLYDLTKELDPTRSINDNCGWEHVCTDLTTFHDYDDVEETCASLDLILGPKGGRDLFVGSASHRPGAPIMCTEFGGIKMTPPNTRASDRDWGYSTASNPEELLKNFEKLVKGITGGGHCCAFVYTQLTDIEQEVNGLYTYDRREKLPAKRVKAVIDEAVGMFYDRVGSS